MLLPPRVPGAAGVRVLHPLPAIPAGGPLPHRSGPGPGRRRPHVYLLMGRAMSEVKQFRLPDVGEGLTEADIVTWRVKPGDRVTVNQVIVEIETAKAVVELPSPYEGVVTGLLVSEGQTVDVGTPIIEVDVAEDAGTAQTGTAGSGTAGAGAGRVTSEDVNPRPVEPAAIAA